MKRLQPRDLVERKVREQAQEPADIGVMRVPPELPIIIGGQGVIVQPYRARHRLAHFGAIGGCDQRRGRSEEHTSELQSLMRISYAVFCLKKKNHKVTDHTHNQVEYDT